MLGVGVMILDYWKLIIRMAEVEKKLAENSILVFIKKLLVANEKQMTLKYYVGYVTLGML